MFVYLFFYVVIWKTEKKTTNNIIFKNSCYLLLYIFKVYNLFGRTEFLSKAFEEMFFQLVNTVETFYILVTPSLWDLKKSVRENR